MFSELEKTIGHMMGWFFKKVMDALFALFWVIVWFAVIHGVPVLEKVLRVVFNALKSFTRRLIRTFEDQAGISITHSPVLTFIAWIVVWGLVILPSGAVFLVGFGTLVGLISGPSAQGSFVVAAAMAVIPLIIGVLFGSTIGVEGGGRASEVEWGGRAGFSGADFDGGLRIGDEVTWY